MAPLDMAAQNSRIALEMQTPDPSGQVDNPAKMDGGEGLGSTIGGIDQILQKFMPKGVGELFQQTILDGQGQSLTPGIGGSLMPGGGGNTR